MKYITLFLLNILVFLPFPSVVTSFAAEKNNSSRHFNVGDSGLAMQGYDPVSYFSGIPLTGKLEFTATHGGITYRFASQKTMNQFVSEPDKYIPAYGGWCAWAMLDGEKVDIDPERFKVIDGINYLYYDGFWGNTLKKWEKRAEKEGEAALVRQSAGHWQKIVSR
ncbi:MAG: YHS domain-containing (seleno)protein [Desulforhopalus sp.]